MPHQPVACGKKQRNAPSLLLFLAIVLMLGTSAPGEQSPLRIMPLGDSITRGGSVSDGGGYRRPLYEALVAAGMNVDFVGSQQSGVGAFDKDHEGHSGWRDSDIAANVAGFLTANPADVVLLHIGINSLDTNPSDVQAILNNIDSVSPDTVVVLARIVSEACCGNTPPCQDCQWVTQFNDNVAAMAAARIAAGDKIILVDMEHALAYPGDLVDSVHPNASGYGKMTAVWLPAIAEARAMLQHREMIGIACTGRLTADGHMAAVADREIMGVQPQAHWNSTGEGLAAGGLTGLKGASGVYYAGAAASWMFDEASWSQNAVEGQSIPPASLYDPVKKNHKLMGGLLRAASPRSLNVTGLDSVFGAGASYDVIVYIDAWDHGYEGRWKSVVQAGAQSRTLQSLSFTDAAGFDDATADGLGNYVLFTGVVGDGIAVTVSPFGGGPGQNAAFLNGVQIIGCSAGTARPAIERQPAGMLVRNGGDAVFTIAASGAGTLHYQWRRNGIELGQDSDRLVISGVRPVDDGATITCTVRDDCGTTVSSEALLTVGCALTVGVTGAGSVASEPPGGLYRAGTTIKLTPLPAAGWVFSSWSGSAGGSSVPLYVRMIDDLKIGAVFAVPPRQFRLTTRVVGHGGIATSPAGESFAEGATVRLEAVADAGWQFVGWAGAATGSDPVASVMMNADLLVEADFAEQRLATQAPAGGNSQPSGRGNLWGLCGAGAAPATLFTLLVFAPRKRRRLR